MKPIFILIALVLFSIALSAQKKTPPIPLCFAKQCIYGGFVKKTATDTFTLKPVNVNYEVINYVIGFTIKEKLYEISVIGDALPLFASSAFNRKGNVPIYFTDVNLKNNTTGKTVKSWFKIILVD